ncbi:GDH/6PGL endoplasmic bifunctional protein-like isoform X2 [Mercenaria mercenaria]|nr:GDH/6PGL endoplasmic bifunctional protein-like isoform X2 [Mercenaria mercenaria]XP_053384972.1 GDH/6PGL endoplasmic bifunctional protein-like isoform X2 [Mercenaria mercenaria]
MVPLLLCSLLFLNVLYESKSQAAQHTNFVIVGGTGDLARKYLWGSALRLFVENFSENNTFSFYAGARVSQTDGDKALNDILNSNKCDSNDPKCEKLRPKFLENAKYVVLKYDENYTNLCNTFRTEKGPEITIHQIFYLSIPSSAYQSVTHNIHSNCRHEKISSTKVVLEKPFGLDKESAAKQAEVISEHFHDDEVHRVDHYLAKSVSKQILNFRAKNREILDELLNGQFVDRIEIVMKERIGNKGRIDFYDQTGVVRDVMQNHLTELLALVAMELPVNISDCKMIEDYKLHLLRQVKPVSSDALLFGQYAKYVEEAKDEIKNIDQSHLTPTFAAALLQINNPRWRGVPFILTSGKHMDERTSHVRILFREKEFCVSGCADGNSTFTKYPRQLIFQIGHGPVPSAGILVSKSLFNPSWPSSMKELPMTSKDSAIHGQSPGDFHYAVPVVDTQAYTMVIHDLYHNNRESFVTTARMLLLWEIWDNVIKETSLTVPRLYKEFSPVNLNFTVDGLKLRYLGQGQSEYSGKFDGLEMPNFAVIPPLFRNKTLFCKPLKDLVKVLATYIFKTAENAIKERNIFHIAFSGGNTPVILFKELLGSFPLFPWEQTHIWQVDERCVSQKHENSNFLSLHDNLIKFTNIPYFNIHPMPVSFAGKICAHESKGDNLYEDMINHLIPAQVFDLILLGLGTDGHTASLFPGYTHSKKDKRLVALTKSKADGNFDRMSLLPPLINNAREVTVLVTTKEKHSILQKISDIQTRNKQYPITYVSPVSGNMSWFIDIEAWLGQ